MKRWLTLFVVGVSATLISCFHRQVTEIPIPPPTETFDSLVLDFPSLTKDIQWDSLAFLQPYASLDAGEFGNWSKLDLDQMNLTDFYVLVLYSFNRNVTAYSRLRRNYCPPLVWTEATGPLIRVPRDSSRFILPNEAMIEIADAGGEIQIERITHGDRPLWIDLSQKNEFDALEKVLADKDQLHLQRLGNSETGVFKLDQNSQSMILDPKHLNLDGKPLSEYRIADFKVLFPKSYAVRNFYGDSYLINFAEKLPESYDHLILKTERPDRYVLFRFVNTVLVEVVLDGNRGY